MRWLLPLLALFVLCSCTGYEEEVLVAPEGVATDGFALSRAAPRRAVAVDSLSADCTLGACVMPADTFSVLLSRQTQHWPAGSWGYYNERCSLADGVLMATDGHPLVGYGTAETEVRMLAYAPYDDSLSPQDLWGSYTFRVDTLQETAAGRLHSDLIVAGQSLRVWQSQQGEWRFRHLMAKLTVRLTVHSTDGVPLRVDLQNVGTVAQVGLLAGTAEATGFGSICLLRDSLKADSVYMLCAYVAPSDFTLSASLPSLLLNGTPLQSPLFAQNYASGTEYTFTADVTLAGNQVEYGVNLIENGDFAAAGTTASSVAITAENAAQLIPGWTGWGDGQLCTPEAYNSYRILRNNDVYALLMNSGQFVYGGTGEGLYLYKDVDYRLSLLYCGKSNTNTHLLYTLSLQDDARNDTNIDTICLKATVTLTISGNLDSYTRHFSVPRTGHYSLVFDVRYAVAVTGLRLEAVP